MCQCCEPLLKAIENYLEKADDDLKDVLDEEGRADPDETVKAMNKIEDGVAAALVAQTNYFIREIQKKNTLSELMDVFEEIKAKDAYCDEIQTVVAEQLHKLVPKLVKSYVYFSDKSIKITAISQKAYDWIDSWSSRLATIMKLNSHTEIEQILKDGLANGSDIASVTRAILDSGIRDEYYKARRVAVTEILGAHNVAKQEAAMQNPCVTRKLWRHTGAYKNQPRENHVDMDRQCVPVDQPFTLKGIKGGTFYPMYPTDVDLPPEERINCHCIAEDVVDDDILAMPLEERQRLQREALAAIDADWERELNERNKARAGIE